MDVLNRRLLAELDLGNLLYEDKSPIDPNDVNKKFLRELTLNCTHHFLGEFWKLPTELHDNVLVSNLPEPSFRLPREKPAPKAKDLSKWDRFAQMKGIRKHKKSKKVWDEESKSWKSRWGKDRVDSLKEKWVIEVPDNADPYEDQFEKLSKARKERTAKNELSRLKNIARSVKKGQAPPVGVLTEADASKNSFIRALEITKRSDASMGRFSEGINEQKIASKAEKRFSRGKKGKKAGPSRHSKNVKRVGKHPKKK